MKGGWILDTFLFCIYSLTLQMFVVKGSASSVDVTLLHWTSYLWPLTVFFFFNFSFLQPMNQVMFGTMGYVYQMRISKIATFWRNQSFSLNSWWNWLDASCCTTNRIFPFYDYFLECNVQKLQWSFECDDLYSLKFGWSF